MQNNKIQRERADAAMLVRGLRTLLFPRPQKTDKLKVCVPVTGFPVTGGTRSVLAKIEQVTGDIWQLAYVTQRQGPGAENFATVRFGARFMSPWQFPNVWFYCIAGLFKLLALLRQGAAYDVLLPQDGVFTAAFAALAGKLAGIRVVCIDHGNLTLLKSRIYRREHIEGLSTKHPAIRLLARILYTCYWPSLSLLARISAHTVDHFLIPGVPGDDTEIACQQLGIPPDRITRFATMIDSERYGGLDAATRESVRRKYGIATGALVIIMVCRLTPEKGIDIALEAINQALFTLDAAARERVRIVIAGEGPLRPKLVKDIEARGLSNAFLLPGEVSATEVVSLLGSSDIFLYTSVRGACLSMAILEAMASGCAIVASTLPMANVHMLAEGRGITVPPGDVEETARVLSCLLKDTKLRQRMGIQARDYAATQHNATQFRRLLLQATYCPVTDEISNSAMDSKG